MLELIQHYSNNKNKLFALFIELLYSFTLLFFACKLYGLELNFDDLLIEVKSISVNFFLTIIGVGLTYLIIVIAAQLIILITSLIILRLTDWINYQKDRRKLKGEVKSSFTFDQYRKQKEISSNEAAHKLFSGLNEKQFPRLKDYYLGNNATLNSGRIFIILLAYLIIRLTFKEEDSSVFVNWIIGVGLLVLIIFFNNTVELENALGAPDFFKNVEERRLIRGIRKIINDNKYCTKKRINFNEKETIIDNLFFISNRKKKIIGWIVIIDSDWNNDSHLEELLKNDSLGKGVYKILVDIFDFVPDKYLNEENLKIIKSIDTFNLDKEVNALLIEDRNRVTIIQKNTSAENLSE